MKAICLEGIDLGGDEPTNSSELEYRNLFIRWNKHIKGIEKQVDTLLEKISKKEVEEAENKEAHKVGKHGHEDLVIP